MRRVRALVESSLLCGIATSALVASACSSNPDASPPPASAGSGGALAGGAPPLAAGSSGVSSGGSAGIAGARALDACTDCAAAPCGTELAACRGNSECAPWLECVSACSTTECVATCDREHADVARVYRGIYACMCGSCADSCGAARSCDKQCTDEAPIPVSTSAPRSLAETGLFASGSSAMPLQIAPGVEHFTPQFPLWSDGADKDRYIYIPKCSTIDTSNMDRWDFPVGTRLWKSFSVTDPGGSKRLETRLLHHYGPGQEAWLLVAYQWSASAPSDPTAALAVPDGVSNSGGTAHDIPSTTQCLNCHDKLRERVIGFSAIQLSHPAVGNDLNMRRLSERGWLSVPAPEGFRVPGDPVQQAALGYLHGNCGGCHNTNTQSPPGSPMMLRLLVDQTEYESTDLVATTVGVGTFGEQAETMGMPRVAPMNPGNSSLVVRMKARGSELQMPPLVTTSTEQVDTAGVALVTAWVNALQ